MNILSLSYGKDSLACLQACQELGIPIDGIVHSEVWATDTIPADPPEMVEFKAKADAIIKERYGLEVTHVCAMTTPDKKYGRFRHSLTETEQESSRSKICSTNLLSGESFPERSRDGQCSMALGANISRPLEKKTFEDIFYRILKKPSSPDRIGHYTGWPMVGRCMATSELKLAGIKEARKRCAVHL